MIGNICKSYSFIISEIHRLLHKIIDMGKLIKIQWIPSHIIFENDIAEKMAKTACNWQTVSEFFPEFGKVFQIWGGVCIFIK